MMHTLEVEDLDDNTTPYSDKSSLDGAKGCDYSEKRSN